MSATEWERTAERDPDHDSRVTAGNRVGLGRDEPPEPCLPCRFGACDDCDLTGEPCPCAEAGHGDES